MKITPEQIEKISECTGWSKAVAEYRAREFGDILDMLEPEQQRALCYWFRARNRAIAEIKQQPFFRRKQ